jgi:hypothetical protein
MLRHRGERGLHRVRDECGRLAVAFAADSEAVDDDIGTCDAALDVSRQGRTAGEHGETRVLQRHAARIAHQGDDLVALFDRLREKKFFSEVESAYYITQTIKALIYLHSHNIIHRDLKP